MLCKECGKYPSTLVADRSQPSVRRTVAPQTLSDSYERFIYAYPLTDTGYCYYCTKRRDGRIADPQAYSYAYFKEEEYENQEA